MPLTISWSALKTHEECRQRHKLVQTRKSSPVKDIRQFFHGTVSDRVMRWWLNQDDPRPGEMSAAVEDIMREQELEALATGDGVVRWKHREDKRQMTEYIQELVTRLEPILYELVVPYEYEPELRYRTPVKIPFLDGSPATINLAGGIDIVVRMHKGATAEEHRWGAIDLKGTANDQYIKQTMGQGIFYDLSMRSLFGKSPEYFSFVQPMCRDRVVTLRITDQERAEMRARIERMAHYMWRKDWTPKEDTKGCDRCEVRHACERFRPVAGSARRVELQQLAQRVAASATPQDDKLARE